MNIIVQNTGGDSSSLNGKIESPNKTIAITRALLLNSSHKSSRNIIKYLIRNFNFTIERRGIATCSLNYDVQVVACPHKF